MATISFLLFAAGDCPGGGLKIIYEHANHLVSVGHQVHIIYPAAINLFRNKSIFYRANRYRIYLKRKYRIGFSAKKWFSLDSRVKEHWVYSLNFNNIPKSDRYIATEARTSYYLNSYPVDKSKKFYFIQGYENWFITDSELIDTYKFELNKITITHWLQEIIKRKVKQTVPIVPNGFDFNEFHTTIPIRRRNKYKISVLYNTQEVKDFPTVRAALEIVKSKIPQIEVLVFGEPEQPQLPSWFHYFRKPDRKTHLNINNEAAIYVAGSKVEGFGLTIGEAMLCSQAVACTDNLGYCEMAINEQTALVSPIQNPSMLADNIMRLINDDELRFCLSEAGEAYVREHFSWEKSYKLMQRVLNI